MARRAASASAAGQQCARPLVDAAGGRPPVCGRAATSAALIRFALATGCRAREITGLEWDRVDLKRRTAWLDQTKNGTPRGVPLNRDAVNAEREKHPVFCFTYRGEPIAWEMTNSAWHTACEKAGISDFRFHDLGTRGRRGTAKPVRAAMSSRIWALEIARDG